MISFQLDRSNLTFTISALNQLRDIKDLKSAEEFIRRYGSHLSTGLFQLGGILWHNFMTRQVSEEFIEFKTLSETKYFLIDDYGNLIDFNNPQKDIEIIKKIINTEQLVNLDDPEFDSIIENQIYLGLLYSNSKYINLFDLDLIDTLHIFTKTIVDMVLQS